MKTDLNNDSAFAQWLLQKRRGVALESDAVRAEALEVLLESFDRGEIESLDGVTSAMSKSILAELGERPFEMNSRWILSAQDWVCPCCRRNKREISRIGTKGQILAKLMVHHDHMGEVLREEFCRAFVGEGTQEPQSEGKRLVDRIGDAFSAYEQVLICEDCNQVDGKAKKALGLPKYFSFSIAQIARFITPLPHVPHVADLSVAQQVWSEAQAAYQLRMRLVRAVARASATDAHWYEPYDRQFIPIPVFGYADAQLGCATLQHWISLEALVKALGPKKEINKPNRSRWRTMKPKAAKSLPENHIAMLRSERYMAERWDNLPAEWHCPVCCRDKNAVIYVSERGEVIFQTSGTSHNPKWRGQVICGHCRSVIMSMKEEVTEQVGHRMSDSYECFTPTEFRAILEPKPHSAHSIKPEEAAKLVALVVARVRRLLGEQA